MYNRTEWCGGDGSGSFLERECGAFYPREQAMIVFQGRAGLIGGVVVVVVVSVGGERCVGKVVWCARGLTKTHARAQAG
jgi:hypothetical protein